MSDLNTQASPRVAERFRRVPPRSCCCSNLCGYVWPAYQCFKAIEQGQNDAIRDWCIYWYADQAMALMQGKQQGTLATCLTASSGSCWRFLQLQSVYLTSLLGGELCLGDTFHLLCCGKSTRAVLCRLPMYYTAKVAFVIYLWHPKTQGALTLYTHTVQPLLRQNESLIDQYCEGGRAWVFDAIVSNFRW